jgi:AcrR family transcriptional regulator
VTKPRDSYHHGDLRNALVAAGAELAEAGGPSAVTIRAAAARVGVTPTAAYRHFADHADLLDAVRREAMSRLSAAMTRYLRTTPVGDDAEAALRRLRATGRGYVQFAVDEPGLFRAAFAAGHKPSSLAGPAAQDGPFAMLNGVLDRLVEVGYLAPQDRPLAEMGAWATVHGLAFLLIEGPLRTLKRREREAVIERSLEMVHVGLGTGPAARSQTSRPAQSIAVPAAAKRSKRPST